MFEGSMMSTGWGYVGTDVRGFEWLFTPDQNDVAYCLNPANRGVHPFCRCMSGYVFKNEASAIRDGKKWMKEAGRSGTITAVKATPRHFEY